MPPKHKSAMRLGLGLPGSSFRVLGVDGGPGVQARLMGIGLISGAEVNVIRNDGRGPMILGLRRARIGIGRGMAEKVCVEPVSKPAEGKRESA